MAFKEIIKFLRKRLMEISTKKGGKNIIFSKKYYALYVFFLVHLLYPQTKVPHDNEGCIPTKVEYFYSPSRLGNLTPSLHLKTKIWNELK